MTKPMTDEKLQKAIDKLADCFEYGQLQASTAPAEFIERAANEIRRLRDENERLRTALVVAEDHLRSHWEVVHPVLDKTLGDLDEEEK